MFFVYGIQAIDEPEGPIKIGFSLDPLGRTRDLELGSLGKQLHVIFQTEAGMAYGDGRRLEKIYHDEFALLRMDRETFQFSPKMLTWRPDGTTRAFTAMRAPASNTHETAGSPLGDVSFDRKPVQRRNDNKQFESGDLSAASSVQKIVQRKTT